MKREIFQQGDVIFIKIKAVPEGAKKQQQCGRLILVEGEHTGHVHAIEEKGWGTPYQVGDILFLDVTVPVTVRHEEHRPQVILPGVYEITRVREINPFTEEIQTVKD